MLQTDQSTPLSNFLESRIGRDDVPAVVAAVVNRDAQLYLNAFGKRDVARNLDATPDTIVRIASMTKPVLRNRTRRRFNREAAGTTDFSQPRMTTRRSCGSF
jgi:hypothetical protein